MAENKLEEKPNLAELIQHVRVGSKWHLLGVLLELDGIKLNDISEMREGSDFKALKMFQLWLETNPNATRRQVIDALKKEPVKEMTVADNYEKILQSEPSAQVFEDTTDQIPPLDQSDRTSYEHSAISIFQCHFGRLQQSLQDPISVALFLHNEKIISEVVLNSVKSASQTLEDRRIILLTALQDAIHNDYQFLKMFAKLLLEFTENVPLANAILKDYRTIIENDTEVDDYYDVPTSPDIAMAIKTPDQSHVGIESDKYSSIPIRKHILTDPPLNEAKRPSCDNDANGSGIIRKRKIDSNPENESQSKKLSLEPALPDELRQTESQIAISHHITPAMKPLFSEIRSKFGRTFFRVRKAFLKNSPLIEDLKTFLQDIFPGLKPQIAHVNTIDDILNIIREKCTLIDINYLEIIVEEFDIREAKSYIEAYKSYMEEFCRTVSVKLCLDESFNVKTSSSLKGETATFILDWDPDNYTINDIKEILSVCLQELSIHVQVETTKKANSIEVVCQFSLSLAVLLIAKAQETIDCVKKRGLIKLKIGHCLVFDKSKMDKEDDIRDLEKKVNELEDRLKKVTAEKDEKTKDFNMELEMLKKVSRAKTQETEQYQVTSVLQGKELDRQEEINQLTREKEAANKLLVDTQENLEIQREKVSTLTGQLNEREKKITQLVENIKGLKSRIAEVSARFKSDNMKFSQRLDEIVTDKTEEMGISGYTGDIEWCDDRIVKLNLPNMEQCEEVVTKLKEEKQLGQEWSIHLKKSSSKVALVIISDLNECAVTTLDIRYTPLTSSFMSTLSDILSENKTLKRLVFFDSPFPGGDMKQLSTAISTNNTLEELVLEYVHVTDEDTTYLSDMLKNNQTLKLLRLLTCNITDNGIHNIHEGLVKNKAMTRLLFSNNPQITSASTNVIVDLMKNTKSLKELHLAATSLEEKDIETICNALVKVDTMEILMLSKRHQVHCQTLDWYDDIKSKLHFW